MDINCPICEDNFDMTSDIRSTLCGHIFHYECVSTWQKRSDTCPQCREVAKNEDLRKLYINFTNNEDYHLARECAAECINQELDILLEENNLLKIELKTSEETLEQALGVNLTLTDELHTLKINAEETSKQNKSLENNIEEYKNKMKVHKKSLKNLQKSLTEIENQLSDTDSKEKDIKNTEVCSSEGTCSPHDGEINVYQ